MFVCRIKTKQGISVDDNRNIICVKLQFIWTCLLRTEDFYLNFHQSKTGTEHDAHIFVRYEMRNVCGGLHIQEKSLTNSHQSETRIAYCVHAFIAFIRNKEYLCRASHTLLYLLMNHLGIQFTRDCFSCCQSEPTISDDGHVFAGSRRQECFTNMGLAKCGFNWFISFRVDDHKCELFTTTDSN